MVTLIAVAGLLLGGVVWIVYLQETHHEASLLSQQGTQRIDEEYDFLNSAIETVRSDVLYLAEQKTLQDFLSGHPETRRELEQEYVRFGTRRSVYDQIRFLDTQGNEVIRVNFRGGQAEIVPHDQLQAKDDRYYYRAALKLQTGEVFVSEFDLNVEHDQIERPLEPVLRFLTPVVDSVGSTRGLLALNYAGNHLLRRLNDLSLPGVTLLVNSSGHYIHGRNADDAWGWLLGHTETFSKHFPSAWQQIGENAYGQFTTPSGLFTFRRVAFSESLSPPGSDVSTKSEDSAPLILVSYVPRELEFAASKKLLKQLMWIYLGAVTLLAIIGWFWARSAAIRRMQADSIIDSEARLRTLSDQLLMTQEEERRNISRELHDDLGQQVTAVSLDLRSAARQSDAEKRQFLLERAIEETDHLLQSIHKVASRVRPAVLDDLGLHDAVESLTTEISQRNEMTVNTHLAFDEELVTPKVGENVYRILQEGLTNIVKHADTRKASVTVAVNANQLKVSLEDHGIGFDPQQRDNSRLGLLGMQERAELLGGRFTLTSNPGSGTRIDVTIPLQNGE
ncbi:MAG: hypothetical protein KDA93_21235 [Planctomycetaceae bacterium]|nr:hypothetical protein [Planctomycetaceae bacterium]